MAIPDPSTIPKRVRKIQACIRAAESRHRRAPGFVTLLAVSKGQGAEAIRAAVGAGLTRFGESYLQEALAKRARLAGLDAEWHFIGPIQSNKTREIAAGFDWVHGVDRAKVARRLNDQRAGVLPPLQVCVQVNLSGEAGKSGVAPGDLEDLAALVRTLPRLRLRGLMGIPARTAGLAAQRRALRPLREAFDALNRAGFALDTLSMGMTGDLEAAVAEGATLVRIGTGVFGPRG